MSEISIATHRGTATDAAVKNAEMQEVASLRVGWLMKDLENRDNFAKIATTLALQRFMLGMTVELATATGRNLAMAEALANDDHNQGPAVHARIESLLGSIDPDSTSPVERAILAGFEAERESMAEHPTPSDY